MENEQHSQHKAVSPAETTSKDATSASSSSGFFDLPREIRDIIYSMAYSDPHPEIFTITSKARAQFKATFRHRIYQSQVRTPKGYQALEPVGCPPVEPDKFAHCPLESTPVNRQWYHEATEEFFRRRTIRASGPKAFLSECLNNPKWIQDIRSLEVDMRDQWWRSDDDPMQPIVRQNLQIQQFLAFPHMPNLRSLRIHAHASVFLDRLATKRAHGEVLGIDDFIAIPGIQGFLQVRSVEALKSWMTEAVETLAQQDAERRKLEQEDVETRSKDARTSRKARFSIL